MGVLDFRVLGPLEVVADSAIDLGGPKPRALLAHLLMQVGRVVRIDSLVDALWGEDPPTSASNTLQSYVSRLRKQLGSTRIESRGGGYLLHAETHEVDALRFEELVAEGRSVADTQPEQAAVWLREALQLWRGRPYADVADGLTLGPEITRLEELRLAAVEDRIQADLAVGRHAVVVGELEALLEENPWRERLWGQLMTALYRCGRQAEALRAFQRARRILGEELGIEPSPELRQIEDLILDQSPELGAPVEGPRLAPAPGMSVREYELRASMGRGSFGEVFRAYHASVGREVVIEAIGADLANDPAFIRGFERTARVLGGLEHPNIVPIYDFWREPNGAYFVTGLVDGSTLGDLSREHPPDEREAIGLVEQIAAALNSAHRRGVIHGNLDESAVIIDSDGKAVVRGFGLPPATGGDEAAVAQDLDALVSLAGRVLPRLNLASSDGLGGALEVAAACRAALGLVGGGEPVADTGRNPYKGLRAFEEGDAGDFFGRSALISRLLARLDEEGSRSRFLAVVGPSGSGKSSVVKAGLVPGLRRGGLPGSDRWFMVDMFPGRHPYAELEAALFRIAVDPPPDLLTRLEEGALGILRGINRVVPDRTSDVLIVIDQFEELFTLVAEAERDRFLEALTTVLDDPHSRLRVVVTLRADFYDRPLAHHGLASWMRERTEVVVPLTRAEVEEAITGPARRVGVEVEPALAQRMIGDVAGQPGALPLLQYALTGLFDHRTEGTMTLGAYESGGGISGAVATRAEAVYGGLAEAERAVARQVFLRFVSVAESGEATRRRVRRSELMGLGIDRGAVAGLIEAFGSQRLLAFGRDPISRGPTVEVAHEALFSRWPRYAGWIGAAAHDVRAHQRMAEAAREWSDAGRSPDYLLTGRRLDEVTAWVETTDFALSARERDFVAASAAKSREAERLERERREREAVLERRSARRLRVLAAVLLVAAVVAGGLSVFALTQRGEAREEARLSRARALVAEAFAALDDDPELAVLLALEAVGVDVAVGRDAAAVLHLALPAHRTMFTVPGSVAAAAPNGRWIATGDADGAIRRYDPSTGELVGGVGSHDTAITALAISRDGSALASGDIAGSVRIWDVASGTAIGGWDAPYGGEVVALRFTPDGRRLAVAARRSCCIEFRDRAGVVVDTLGEGSDVALSGDGTLALTPTVLFRVDTGESFVLPATDPREGAEPDVVAFSSTGRHGFVAGGALVRSYEGPPLSSSQGGQPEPGFRYDELDAGSPVSALAADSADTRVAAGTIGGEVVVWDLQRGTEVMKLAGHRSQITVMEFFGTEEDRLLTASSDGTTRVWDVGVAGARELLTLEPTERGIYTVGISGDGSVVAVVDESSGVLAYDVASAEILHAFQGDLFFRQEESQQVFRWEGFNDVALNHDGTILATTVGFSSSSVSIWDLPAQELLVGELGDQGGVTPEGASDPFSLGGDPEAVMGAAAEILLETVWRVELSPDGSQAAFIGQVAGVLELQATDPQRLIGVGEGRVFDVAYAPDGSRLLVGDPEGLLLFDPRLDDRVDAYGPGAYARRTPSRLDTPVRLIHPDGLTPFRVAYGPNGVKVAAAWREGGVSVFDIASGEMSMHTDDVPDAVEIAFVSGGSMVAVLVEDGRLYLLDAESGRPVVTISDHVAEATDLAATPDGRLLATSSMDGTVRLYVMDESQLFDLARSRLSRGLSGEECRRYSIEADCPAN
jgi:DNA-binding SARP family transcriptional activator/WD40 repeat protein